MILYILLFGALVRSGITEPDINQIMLMVNELHESNAALHESNAELRESVKDLQETVTTLKDELTFFKNQYNSKTEANTNTNDSHETESSITG